MEIEFTSAKLRLLKKEYNKAVESKLDVFQFEGKEFVTSYAKYLIEYLQDRFKISA